MKPWQSDIRRARELLNAACIVIDLLEFQLGRADEVISFQQREIDSLYKSDEELRVLKRELAAGIGAQYAIGKPDTASA